MLTNMYSLTVKPSFFLPKFYTSSSSVHFWAGSCSSSVTFRIKTKNRGSRLRIHAYESSKSDSPNASGDSKPPNGTLVFLYLPQLACQMPPSLFSQLLILLKQTHCLVETHILLPTQLIWLIKFLELNSQRAGEKFFWNMSKMCSQNSWSSL